MKKIYLNIVSAALVVMGVLSCSTDSLMMNGGKQLKANEVVASVEGQASTRLAIVDAPNKSMVWTSGDQIAVFDESGFASTLDLNNESANQSFGTFGGDLAEGFGTLTNAVYPSEGSTLSGSTLTMSIPAEIPLADVEMLEGGKAYKFPLPMFGKFDNKNVEFKFLTGMLKLIIGNLPAKTEKIIITADKPISGTFTASLSGDETPVLASTSENASDKVITVTFSPLEETGTKTIFIPLAAQNYGSITVQAAGKYDGSAESTVDIANWTDKTVVRRMVYTAVHGYTIEVDATSPSAVSEAIEGTIASAEEGIPVTVVLTGTVTTSADDKEITIPTVNSGGDAIDVSMVFDNLPEAGSTLAIKTDQAGCESTVAKNKLFITFPSSDTGVDLNIDAPTSTVTLQSESGTTKFGEVSARTAFNTLVVDDDVTVDNVEIEDGVVQINNDGFLESWSFAANNNGDQVFINEDGGIIPLTLQIQDENGNFIDQPQIITEDGGTYYAHSLKIDKGDADYSIVWFNNTSADAIPLKTVVISDDAVLQTNAIQMENIVGEDAGTGVIKYRFTYLPSSGFTDDPLPNGERNKFFEYFGQITGVKNIKKVTFVQPEIAPEDWIIDMLQDSIAAGYVMNEPRLNLDVDGEVDGCTINYNDVYFCNGHSYECPTVKNCKFVHVDHGTELNEYNVRSVDNDIIECDFPIVYDGSRNSNSITFENCDFSEGTKFFGCFNPWLYAGDGIVEVPDGWNDGEDHFTGYVNFNNCTLGGQSFTGDDADFIKEFWAETGCVFIIRFNGVDKYKIMRDPESYEWVTTKLD